MLGGLTPAHLLIILVIALIVIGPGKLPEVGAAIGKSVREFQKASGGIQETVTGALNLQTPPAHPPQPAPQQPPQTYYAPQQQPYYPAQPQQPYYSAPAQQAPVQYQPAGTVIGPAAAMPAQFPPVGYPQPNPIVQQPPSPPSLG
ncbi:MAG TPA: twin-arginine translocase TatA/TatE family subunit [Candidatus Limnocylindrales bacterium]|jgi:sec-independent protein translocase protein TatA